WQRGRDGFSWANPTLADFVRQTPAPSVFVVMKRGPMRTIVCLSTLLALATPALAQAAVPCQPAGADVHVSMDTTPHLPTIVYSPDAGYGFWCNPPPTFEPYFVAEFQGVGPKFHVTVLDKLTPSPGSRSTRFEVIAYEWNWFTGTWQLVGSMTTSHLFVEF